MRRILITAAAVALVATGCITPPATTNPYACADQPVDLGPGRVTAMSDDGQVLVVASYPVDGEGIRYEVVDRRRGQRHHLVTTSPSGDGAALFMDAAGSRIYGLRYPALAEGESTWFLHDVTSRVTLDIAPILPAFEAPVAFSDDLATAVLRPAPGAPWELLDVGTGARTSLGLVDDPAWRTAAFSPDLSRAVQYSSAWSSRRSVRVVDTATGSPVLDVGQVRNENASYVDTSFVDDRTLLVDDAEPAGSPADAVADDGAFLIDLVDATLIRLDPGVPRSSTYAASPDGRRTMYWALSPLRTEIRIDGVAQQLADINSGVANADLSVVVSGDGGSLLLRCFP